MAGKRSLSPSPTQPLTKPPDRRITQPARRCLKSISTTFETQPVIIYNPDGTVRSTNTLGAVVNTIAGKDVYVIDTATSGTFDGLHKLGAVALVSNGAVLSFVSFDDGSPVTAIEGPADGLTSTQIGQAGAGESLETTDGGATYVTQTSPNSGTVPCFGNLCKFPFSPSSRRGGRFFACPA